MFRHPQDLPAGYPSRDGYTYPHSKNPHRGTMSMQPLAHGSPVAQMTGTTETSF